VVRRQKEVGISIPGDGEYGKKWASASITGPGGVIPFSDWGCQTRDGAVPDSAFALDPRSHHVDQFRRPARSGLFANAYNDPDSGVSSNARSG